MIYVQVSLNVGESYTLSIDRLYMLIDEIKEAIKDESTEEIWTIKLKEMTEEEYEKLPEFEGH